ncbi:carbohydrate ABC transporter permease [Paenibacillus sp. GCM10027626]|uniref:carbohydrate ABC transporter permease n=1 Tax=Paenibacillus sp. GCM10027626 TaxID=3273411 RepID=UPI0036416EEA
MTPSHLRIDYKLRALKWKNKPKEWLWIVFRTVLVAGICFVIIYPLLLKVSVAFKAEEDIYNPTVFLIPEHFTLDNIKLAAHVMDYFSTLRNTFSLSALTMILQTVTCMLAGYGFARFEFKGKGILFMLVILTILVPTQTLIVPMYLQFRHFNPLGIVGLFSGNSGINLINTYWPTIITALTANGLKSGLYIYIFRQFFRGMPKEIEEAALIDGAGGIRTFYSIMLPNALPPLITVMLFSFVWQWNDTFYSSMFMGQVNLMSTEITSLGPNVSSYYAAQYLGDPNYKPDPNVVAQMIDTGILLAILPLIVLYAFVQRYFVESVERTGVVG